MAVPLSSDEDTGTRRMARLLRPNRPRGIEQIDSP